MPQQVRVIRVKPGVRFDAIHPAGFKILAALEALLSVIPDSDLTITCGTERHPVTDPHTEGKAYDVSVQGMPPAVILRCLRFLQQTLGSLFTVLYETPELPEDGALVTIATLNPAATAPHLHIQLRKHAEYPPLEAKASQRFVTGSL